jgi:uncharacterized RmlC-like cupin family protein
MRFVLPVAVAVLWSVGPAGAQQFPAGPGKDILEMKCGVCHSPEQSVAGGGRTAAEWRDVVREMIDNGAEVTGDEETTLIDYLAKNWPLKKPDAALSVTGIATQQQAPIPADEVTLRHKIYGDGHVTIFLLDIPPGQATSLHRHDRDMLSVFVNGGRTRAVFNGAAPVEDTFTPGDVRFRSAGFTHSTENTGTDRFLSVIFEFVDSQGPRASASRPATHICNPGSQTACVDEKPLFCTSKFCVDDLMMAPHAVRPADETANDRILVAVSDYTLLEEVPGTSAAVHTRKSGEIEPMAGGPARRWTNADDPAHLIVVTVR